MQSSAINASFIAYSIALLACFATIQLYTLPVNAASTQVEVAVCNSSTSTAQLSIDSPASDSVVTTSNLVISGTLRDVSQIDVTIDGNYAQTVGISAAQTSFNIGVSLTSGTHTISLEGYDICSIENPTNAVVITYTPAVPPSNGGDTPTNVNPDPGGGSGDGTGASNNGGGIIVSGPSSGGGQSGQGGQPLANDGSAIDGGGLELPAFLQRFIVMTDLDTITQNDTVAGLIRLFVILVGFLVIILASGIVALLWHWREDKATRRHLIQVQLVGFALIVLALLV